MQMKKIYITLPKKQVKKIDQCRELESRTAVIKIAVRNFIIKEGGKI